MRGFYSRHSKIVAIFLFILTRPVAAFDALIQAHGEVRKDLPVEPPRFAEPDWSYYHRTTHLQNDLALLAASCRNARARLLISTPDSSRSFKATSFLSRLLQKPEDDTQQNNDSASAITAPEYSFSEPMSAEDGLPYVILERNDDVDEANNEQRRSSFASLFLRRNPQPKPNPEEEDSPVITTSMFVFGEEGRDLLSSEIAFRIVRRVCGDDITISTADVSKNNTNSTGNLNSNNLNDSNEIADEDSVVLPPRTRIVLVPIANPDGRRISEMGRRCDRTNARDVDIDRNWPSFWREPEVDPGDASSSASSTINSGRKRTVLRTAVSRHLIANSDGAEKKDNDGKDLTLDSKQASSSSENGQGKSSSTASSKALPAGPRPLSEPETRALKSLVETYTPSSYVALRTGALALTTPWDCKPGSMQPGSAQRLNGVLSGVAAGHCTRCRTAPLWNVTGQAKCGTALDHVYGTMNVQFVSAWYVYNDDGHDAPQGDCFRRHNPVSRERYGRVVDNWMHAVLNFTGAVRNWVVLEEKAGVTVAQMNASLSADLASERRAKALARGDVDPEGEDDPMRRVRTKIVHLSNSHFGGLGSVDVSNLESAGRKDVRLDHISGGKVGWANSWLGATAALSLLALCLYVAKKFVFSFKSAPRKRSLFSSRVPIKNA